MSATTCRNPSSVPSNCDKCGEGSNLAMENREYPVMGRNTGLEREPAHWKPGKQEYAVMLTLALISLMVALDATILVSVLPVRDPRRERSDLMLIT